MSFTFGTVSFLMAVVFGIVAAYAILKFSVHHIIVKKHKAAEEILETRKPPEKWKNKLFQDDEDNKEYCLKKLRKLIAHFEKTNLVESEETREMLLGQLEAILTEWKNSEW